MDVRVIVLESHCLHLGLSQPPHWRLQHHILHVANGSDNSLTLNIPGGVREPQKEGSTISWFTASMVANNGQQVAKVVWTKFEGETDSLRHPKR